MSDRGGGPAADGGPGPDVEPYINPNAPFGPVASEQIKDQLLRDELFDRENRAYAHLMRHDPAFVVGRRGAGKTTFLHSVSNGDTGPVTVVDTSNAVAEIEELLRSLLGLEFEMFAEHVARLWDAALWHHVLLDLIHARPEAIDPNDERYDTIRVYLHDLADRHPRTVTQDEIFSLFCERFLEEAMERRSLARNPTSIVIGETSLGHILAVSNELLTEVRVQPVLLMDSIEDFKRLLIQHTSAIEGLFMQVGRSAQPKAPYRIRFSFPAELWHVLREMSLNPLKDFGSFVLLHWSAREILKIAAHRYLLYLQYFHEPWLRSNRSLASLNVERERDALALVKAVLPARIRGELGIEEEGIAYVLRHTQLLPRHLLRMLNAIWLREPAREGAVTVEPRAVIQGVRDVEDQIVTEICKAYELVHPTANEVCRAVIKNLPRRFTDSQLHRTFNQVGKGALKRANERIQQAQAAEPARAFNTFAMPDPRMDYFDFKAMLLEIGCLGRLIEETERYHVAEFEYTVHYRLAVGDVDEMCVHPLFSGVYQSMADPEIDKRVVYPYGTNPEIDHRPR
ncbi:MAG: hypothetical protein AAGA93_16665 [Actinomycetota bacterium]